MFQSNVVPPYILVGSLPPDFIILFLQFKNWKFSELKQIQNEKRRLLVETETEKLKSLDESFKKKFEHWRDKLGPRKQVSLVTNP